MVSLDGRAVGLRDSSWTMEAEFVRHLTAQSVLAELPAFDVALELEERGSLLNDTFNQNLQLPGVVLTEEGRVRGSISRGQYMRLVSRHLGREVYLPRPIRLMFEAVAAMEEPLLLPSETPIQEAVGRALERPRELIYEPVIVENGQAGRRVRLVDFQDLLMADSRISTLRNQQMRQILSTVQEGFLMVDRDGTIASEYSRSIQSIFDTRQIGGRAFQDLLTSCLGSERAELGRGYLDTLFNPNVIEKLVTKINPLIQVAAQTPSDQQTKHLAFGFTRIVQDSEIRRVLVRVEDVSRAVELAAELEGQEQKTQEKVALTFDIVRADPAGLSNFVKNLDQQIQRIETLRDDENRLPAGARLDALFRGVHALKGEAGMLGMRLYQTHLHRFEDQIAECRDSLEEEDSSLASLSAGFGQLSELAQETRSLLSQFRRLGGAEAPVQNSISRTTRTQHSTEAPNNNEARKGSKPEALPLFEPIHHLVQELAQRLGKSARFYTQVDEASIPATYRELMRQVLVQMARNALVHGLETPEIRKQRGKAEIGTLQFAVREHPKQLEYIIQDDGAGLDLEAIRRKAVARGLRVPDEAQVPRLIFESGFSTAEETTMDAGRGVGMDLILAAVQEHGGTIRPFTQPGAWCAFHILLPRPATSQERA